jgi:hypothetical protein
MIIFRAFILLCCAAAPALLAAQGALDGYMKGRGHFDLAPSFSSMRASYFLGRGATIYDEPYRGGLVSVFGAYGVTDRFDLIANVPYIFTNDQRGLQDGGFYAKYRPVLIESKQLGRLGIIAGTGVSLPLSDYEPLAAGALGQRAVVVPGRLIVQWDSPIGLFVNLTGGWNWRLDQLKDEDIQRIRLQRPNYQPIDPPGYATYMLKLGFPAAKYYLDGWVEHQRTAADAGTNYVQGIPDLPQAYGVTYTQMGGTLYYSESGRLGLCLSGALMLDGRNVSEISRITVGFVYKH